MLRAHPRVGGENAGPIDAKSSARGSSPRGRGKRYPRRNRRRPARLIPAWAGKTRLLRWRSGWAGAHPRVGGENANSGLPVVSLVGSSPRGRGKRGRPRTRKRCRRLIPAWAGKTSRGSSWPQQRGAHPRVGGENGYLSVFRVTGLGSSPRGRGKRDLRRVKGVTTGLIPAWAGKTAGYGARAGRGRAHPRVGGENLRMPSRPQSKTGSSPRGRGKPWGTVGGITMDRLIPAWAGKTPR